MRIAASIIAAVMSSSSRMGHRVNDVVGVISIIDFRWCRSAPSAPPRDLVGDLMRDIMQCRPLDTTTILVPRASRHSER
jgi:hypothetical protein